MFGTVAPIIATDVSGNPHRCALIDNGTNIVVNVIMADPSVDPAPEGHTIISLIDNDDVQIGWSYDPETTTFNELAAES